jgi:hypothetical protein
VTIATVPVPIPAHPPGYGFGSFVLVAIVVAFLVSVIRDVRSHSEQGDADQTEAVATAALAAGAPSTRGAEPVRSRAARRGRQAFRRSRKHGWLRRLLPGRHGESTPAAVAADGVAAAFAVFAYVAGFTAGLAHAKTTPASEPPPAAGTGQQPSPEPPEDPTDRGRKNRPRTKGRRIHLPVWLQRKPVEGEVVDPEPVPQIGTARDADVIDADVLDDPDAPDSPAPEPQPRPEPAPHTQGDRPMASIQTIRDLFGWTKSAHADADVQAAEAEMRAKVAAGRAEDAAAVAQAAAAQAATLTDVYAYWATQNMDAASLASIEDALQSARLVQSAESHRAECEAATAQANYGSVAAIRAYQESLAAMAATVKARQMQHAEAQRDTGNAAAAAAVLEGA